MKNRIGSLLFAIVTLVCVTASCSDGYVDYDTYGTISGTVIDMETREPIRSASVNILPGSTNTYTSYDGTYEFIELEGGVRYTVQANKDGYLSDRKETTVIAGRNVNVDLFLKKDE